MLDAAVRRGNAAIGYMPQNRGAVAALRLTAWDVVASAAIGRRFGFVRLDKARAARSTGRSTRSGR